MATSFALSSAQKLIGEERVQSFYLLCDQARVVLHRSAAMNCVGSFFQLFEMKLSRRCYGIQFEQDKVGPKLY